MNSPSIEGFVDRLAAVATGPGCNNFFDHAVPANAQRRRNVGIYLQEMLDRSPKVLLVGEAPGFRGMRITGVPFTNRTMFEGPANSFGLFGHSYPCYGVPARGTPMCPGGRCPTAPQSRPKQPSELPFGRR
jgi:hypothetical protein